MHGVHGRMIQDSIHTEGHDVLARDVLGCTSGGQWVTHLDRGHDCFHILGVEFQDAVEDADFIIAEGLLAGAMELEERLELGLLVRVRLVRAENMVQKLGNGPGNWGWSGVPCEKVDGEKRETRYQTST